MYLSFKFSKIWKRKNFKWIMLSFLIIGAIHILTTQLASPSLLSSQRYQTGRLPKAFFMETDSDYITYSDSWPNVTYIQNEIMKYSLQNNDSTTKFPWNYQVSDSRNAFCANKYSKISSSKTYNQSVCVIISIGSTPLMQTLSSVMYLLYNTPPSLIKNIFLVADSRLSEAEFDILEDLLVPVPFFRTFKLTRVTSDLKAVAFATGFADTAYYVMMNAKVIVGPGWLEPLVREIAIDYRNVLVPSVSLTLERDHTFNRRRELDWDLELKWAPETSKAKYVMNQPAIYENLFLVSSKYFSDIGGFDQLKDASGAEAQLWSIKTWLCFGKILKAPCSLVFEDQQQSNDKHGTRHPLDLSIIKYKSYIAKTFFGNYQNLYLCLDTVNVVKKSSNKNVRNSKFTVGTFVSSRAHHYYIHSLKCSSFKTFLRTAQPQMKAPPSKTEHYGKLKVKGSELYVGLNAEKKLILVTNSSNIPNDFIFSSFNLRFDKFCVDPSNSSDIKLKPCSNINAMAWQYNNNMLMTKRDPKFCLTHVRGTPGRITGSLRILRCDQYKRSTRFEFSFNYVKGCGV